MVLIIRKLICIFVCLAALFNLGSDAFAESLPSVSAATAVVISSEGDVVFDKNADTIMPVASTTKILTAIVAIENGDLNSVVSIKPEYCGIEGSSMYLKAGETYTLRELLQGLMLVSGNDAAVAVACHVAGDEESFVGLMNDKAAELEMRNSHFSNPHGLNAENHYSCASDMAKLMAYCMDNEDFARIVGMKSCNISAKTLLNHNKLLTLCEGCIGGKTGFTEAAGRCLVSCCEREGTRFICVTLSAPDDWNDHIKLYEWSFSRYICRNVLEDIGFELPIAGGGTAHIVPDGLKILLTRDTELEAVAEMPRFIFPPIEAGTEAGIVRVYANGKLLGESPLRYENDII